MIVLKDATAFFNGKAYIFEEGDTVDVPADLAEVLKGYEILKDSEEQKTPDVPAYSYVSKENVLNDNQDADNQDSNSQDNVQMKESGDIND